MVKMADVLGIGVAALDEVLVLDAMGPSGDVRESKVSVRSRERRLGGQTGNALVAAARLGGRAAFAGVLGDDSDADSVWVRTALANYGVDVSWSLRVVGAGPVHCWVASAPDGSRTVYYDLSGARGPAPSRWECADHASPDPIALSRVLLVDALGLEGVRAAVRRARAVNVPVVADLEGDPTAWPLCLPVLHEILTLADHLILSRDAAAGILQAFSASEFGAGWAHGCGAEPGDWVRGLAGLRGPWDNPARQRPLTAVTCGAAGGYYVASDRPDTVIPWSARTGDTVETVGCGDVFHGAYALALARGRTIPDAVAFAATAAGLKAARSGGPNGFPTGDDLLFDRQ